VQISGGEVIGSEDCLVLNVFSAASGEVWNQPVMVFFHGGGNRHGSGKWHGRASSVPPQSHSQQRRSGHTITRLAAERRSDRVLSESLS
jgi:hypothetical protein